MVPVNRSTEWFFKWIYFLATAIYFLVVFLHSWQIYSGSPTNANSLQLLPVWQILTASDSSISQKSIPSSSGALIRVGNSPPGEERS